MPEFIGGLWEIFLALLSADSFAISEALNSPAAHVFGIVASIGGGILIMLLFRAVPILDNYFEKTVLVTIYLVIAGVIFVEVIRRFVFQVQEPWSTTLPPFLFLIMTWVGCAYNTRLRAYLSFSGVRVNLPRKGRPICLTLDAVLRITFAVVVTTFKQTADPAANFQILLGTGNVMQWWLYICVPLSWILLTGRVIENLTDDLRRYREGEDMILASSIGGE